MDWISFFEKVMPIGVFATFIGTIITIIYTRKNLKTTKYIDTITSERIKWIEIMRNDLAQLASWLIVYCNNILLLDDLEEDKLRRESQSSKVGQEDDENKKIVEKLELNSLTEEIKKIRKELDEGLKRVQIIEKIYLIKLRLNPFEDTEIIELLDFFSDKLSKFYHNDEEIIEIKKKLNLFVNLAQKVLKSEWNKVKDEVRR